MIVDVSSSMRKMEMNVSNGVGYGCFVFYNNLLFGVGFNSIFSIIVVVGEVIVKMCGVVYLIVFIYKGSFILRGIL